jgi:uncharacterized protein YndB with AHSA1/START domain
MLRKVLLVVLVLAGLIAILWIGGMMLPVEHLATGTRVLTRSPAAVYQLVSDVERYPQWWPDISRVEIVSRIGDGRVTFRQHSSDGPLLMEIVEQQPARRMVTRIADPDQPFGGTWTFDIQPEGDATRLTITERGEIYNPLFRFMARFVFGYTATIESFLAAAARAS